MRERRRGHNRRVLDAHVMMRLVALLQAAQNRDGVFDVWLANVDNLKAPLQRLILFDVFAVLIQRCRANRAQLAPRQRRLEHIAGVDGSLGRARPNERVQLVDKENNLAIGFFDFLEHGLEPVFKLAAKLGSGQHRTQVQRDHALIFEALRHIAFDDALRQALDDGCFAHAGLANQHRVILGAPAQHLNHAANLFVAPNDRVQLAAPGKFREVLGVLFQRLKLGFGILIRHALRPAHRSQRLQNRLMRRADSCQRFVR